MPIVEKSDEELGMEEVMKIMPDTWHNIAWVI